MTNPARVFDAMAASYDSQFTATPIGSIMRRAVWSRCTARFAAGARILDMNCGTGEDAVWLVEQGNSVFATDISESMLEVARRKLASSPGHAAAQVRRLSWEELMDLDEGPFDGALSNFGGLNCVHDLRAAARGLAAKLRPGAHALLCLMGPCVPWEWAWFLARGEPAKAFRRLRRAGREWSGILLHYPSIAETRRAFAPHFRLARACAIGALVPPPYTQPHIGRFVRTIAALNRLERRWETRWPLPLLADHYLLELERV